MRKLLSTLTVTFFLSVTANASLPSDNNDQTGTSRAYFRFGVQGKHPNFPFESTGLSGKEVTHQWSEGEKKEVTFTIPHVYGPNQARVTSVTFENLAVLRPQIMVVCVNNLLVTTLRFAQPTLQENLTIPFPKALTAPAVVSLKIPLACRPEEVDERYTDPRILGVRVTTMYLTLTANPAGEVVDVPSPTLPAPAKPNITTEQLREMKDVFCEIEADYQSYLLFLQCRVYSKLHTITANGKAIDLNPLRRFHDPKLGKMIELTDQQMVLKYFHIAWLIETYGVRQSHSAYETNPTYVDFIRANEKLIIQETQDRKQKLEGLASQKRAFREWKEDKHYNSLQAILENAPKLNLEALRQSRLMIFGPTIVDRDEEVLETYFAISNAIEMNGLENVLSTLNAHSLMARFIKQYSQEIIEETKARKARLAELIEESLPRVSDEHYLIKRFMTKHPQYTHEEAVDIYNKFMDPTD
jgi:hypothetical protein